MIGTLITSEVGFDAEGKQASYLRVPHSTHRSAYGWIPLPIAVIRNGDGPTLVISAGVPGDEYEGQIAVVNLARELDVADIPGCLILLPMVNFPAAEAGCRVSPLDDGNLNRLYHGDPKGAPSEMITHYHEEVILPLADYAVDLHSGGSSLIYPPKLLNGPAYSPEEEAGLALRTEAFDLPHAWVFTGGGGRGSTARTAVGAANRKGVINVMAELGGAGCVTPEVLRQTERGLSRILNALGMLPNYATATPLGTRALAVQGAIYADGSGVFRPLKSVGEDIAEGETVALIHHPKTPGQTPVSVVSPYCGLVMTMRAMAQVRRGDALFQVAADAV